jgi:hypothetical protein
VFGFLFLQGEDQGSTSCGSLAQEQRQPLERPPRSADHTLTPLLGGALWLSLKEIVLQSKQWGKQSLFHLRERDVRSLR